MSRITEIQFSINGRKKIMQIESSLLLIDLIRDELKLKGTKPGCLEGECGACAVLVNGVAVNSCLYPAVNIDGQDVITIEGMSQPEKPLHPVQEKMLEHGAVQCGFCSSGIAISARAFGDECKQDHKIPSRMEVMKSVEGHLCRCTGYVKIVDAVEDYVTHLID